MTAGGLDASRAATDPTESPLDGDLLRTLAWVTALNGGLLLDGLGTGVPTTGATLGHELTAALLRGWGADPHDLADARVASAGWVAAHL